MVGRRKGAKQFEINFLREQLADMRSRGASSWKIKQYEARLKELTRPRHGSRVTLRFTRKQLVLLRKAFWIAWHWQVKRGKQKTARQLRNLCETLTKQVKQNKANPKRRTRK